MSREKVGTVPGEFLNETGEYLFSWDCQTSVRGGYFSGEIDVTLSGEAVDGKDIASRFVLVLFFGILIFFIYSATNKVNFDGWYKKLKSQYEHRNYVKIGLGSIAYQLMKNIWVIFYIIGFIIVIILMDIVYLFNIESIFEAMKGITSIYTWGFILVGLVFLSYLQEFFKGILEQIEEENWGGAENGKH